MALHVNVPSAVSVLSTKSIKEVLDLLQRLGFDQVPVVDEHQAVRHKHTHASTHIHTHTCKHTRTQAQREREREREREIKKELNK